MMDESHSSALKRVAFIGNYLPRQCGIATFTTDLAEAVATAYPDASCLAVAINDTHEGYAYPQRVRFEIPEKDLSAYRRAADFLNTNNVDVVSLQHEYGIFGGPAGSHILALLCDLRMPIVTTLHTILPDPEPRYRKVMEELVEVSDRLVVMTQRGVDFLHDIYHVQPDKIDLIPHGIPDVPFVDPNFYKDQFGVEGKMVLLTFGLLSENKGIEHVIRALPKILERYPNVVYLVLGATHPHVLRHDGETYRLMLERLARETGVADNVIFYNRFVSLPELVEFIGAADLYITPYLNEAQIVSGTLAYTVGAGKAVISTPYWHAQEILDGGRGRLVPFKDPEGIARQVIDLLDNEAERHALRKRAYLLGREMTWPRTAARYVESFERARADRARMPRSMAAFKSLNKRPAELPLLRLDHLRLLTDDTGIIQHALYTVPNYDHGYTTDDNARALVTSVLLEESGLALETEATPLAARYLAFLTHAFNGERGRFRNFLSYDRRWLEETGSYDSHGRALWALGTVLGRCANDGLRGVAGRLFSEALPTALELDSPRAWAFSLIGIHEYLAHYQGDRAAQSAQEELAGRLLALYRDSSTADWPWFEDRLTYANARLPHALLLCGQRMDCAEMADVGLKSLEWLCEVQRGEQGHFVPIGCNGWYVRGEAKARFDQQPIEAAATVSACLAAHRLTGEKRWYREARSAFDWFLGRNDLGLPLYDPTTGGCRDGLQPDRVNANQGAESTLAFLLALLELRLAESIIRAA
jgi:glycosyltransferase involved in cell wall biosynthesis